MRADMFNPPLFLMEGNYSQNEPAPVIPVRTCVRLFPSDGNLIVIIG